MVMELIDTNSYGQFRFSVVQQGADPRQRGASLAWWLLQGSLARSLGSATPGTASDDMRSVSPLHGSPVVLERAGSIQGEMALFRLPT